MCKCLVSDWTNMSNCHPLEVVCRDSQAQLWANVDPWIRYHRDQLTNNCSTTKFKYFGKEANIIYTGPPPLFSKLWNRPVLPSDLHWIQIQASNLSEIHASMWSIDWVSQGSPPRHLPLTSKTLPGTDPPPPRHSPGSGPALNQRWTSVSRQLGVFHYSVESLTSHPGVTFRNLGQKHNSAKTNRSSWCDVAQR